MTKAWEQRIVVNQLMQTYPATLAAIRIATDHNKDLPAEYFTAKNDLLKAVEKVLAVLQNERDS